MANRKEIRLSGYGGQGIILAGYILGQAAAIFEHKFAVFIQDYGPEARGGACRADVVVSDTPVLYPYIVLPSILITLSQQAYDKYGTKELKDTIIIIDEDLVKPSDVEDTRLLAVPPRRIAEELGRVAVTNVVMLGLLTAATEIVTAEAMKKSILNSVPKNTEELNLKAFESGYIYGLENLKPL
jgi:2-oxoglutarate ferredoxin oxidoreductase subunit gamma